MSTEDKRVPDWLKEYYKSLEYVPVLPQVHLVEHRETKEYPVSVELTRGANGVYRWSIKIYGPVNVNVASWLENMDGWLRDKYGQPDLEG